VKLPGNMQQMMKQAQQMQERLQKEIAEIRAEASAGGADVTQPAVVYARTNHSWVPAAGLTLVRVAGRGSLGLDRPGQAQRDEYHNRRC